jgi:hypothetical protein
VSRGRRGGRYRLGWPTVSALNALVGGLQCFCAKRATLPLERASARVHRPGGEATERSDSLVPGVHRFLGDKAALLGFDSCEHVIDPPGD